MADQSAALFGTLQHDPGNPLFPTLPDPLADKLGKIGWPGIGAELKIVPQEPLFGYPQTSAGPSRLKNFGGWYLDQIIITPDPIDFGDIADQKDVDVNFYSTYKNTQSLDLIEIPVDALDITGASPLLPLSLVPFSDTNVTFRAEQAGPQDFDDDITVTVGNLTILVRTLGRRVLMLFGEPENGFEETLNFETDLMRAKNGFEQAFSLRKAPWSAIRYDFFLPDTKDRKRTTLETILFGGAPILPFGVQLWWEGERITSAALSTDTTVFIDHSYMQVNVGETFAFTLPDDTNVFGTVASIDSPLAITFEQAIGTDLPLNTFGTPIRFGHIRGPVSTNTARKNLQSISLTIRTEADVDIGAVDPTYFDLHPSESPGRPILKERCVRSSSMRGSIDRVTDELDSITGRLFVTGTEPLGEWSTSLHGWLNSKAEIYAWRQFLHYIRGSWSTFYMPTFQNDLPLNTAFALGGNTFIVPYMGISTFLDGAAPKRDLRITISGDTDTPIYRRISSIVDNGNDTETITLDGTVGSAGFSQVNETVISWMHLCRLAGDSARFNHTYLGQAELAFRVRSVKE